MNHGVSIRKLGRSSAHRKSMLINLSKSLLRYGHIKTTVAKAKELRKFVEPLITRAKVPNLHNRRILLSRLGGNLSIVNRLMTTIGPSISERPGGYTRILHITDTRLGDAARLAIIELVTYALPQDDIDEDESAV